MPDFFNSRAIAFSEEIENLKEIGVTQSRVGYDILTSLWKIYSLGLYKTEAYNGERFEDFREMCEKAIATNYENPDYFYDFANIVERVFVYVQIRAVSEEPMLHPETKETINVAWIMEQDRWIGKLISISQAIENCKTDEEIEALFNVAITGTREDVKKKGESIKEDHVPTKINFLQKFNGDGSSVLISEPLSTAQIHLILRKLDKIVELHLD